MKLYAFRPKGHGELSFFVNADNESEARNLIDKWIEKWDNRELLPHETSGWGTDYYELETHELRQVVVNSND